jgi:hypothetical protein
MGIDDDVLPPMACYFSLRFVSMRLMMMDKSFDSQAALYFYSLPIVSVACKLYIFSTM